MALNPIELTTDAYRRAPEGIWERMRHEHPLYHDDLTDIWWLTRYEDVAAVFADHETYSASTYEETTGQVLGPTLISRDDYGHVVRRKIVAPDFVGNRLALYRDMISATSSRLIDTFGRAGEVELVGQFSSQLPVEVIAGMLGMVGDGQLFRQWVTDMIMGLAPVDELRAKGLEAHQAFADHIAAALDDVDDPQRTDHIAKIARAEVDGHRLDREEIVAFCGLLFIAGGETTDKVIANMWWSLLSDRAHLEAISEDEELWNNAFSETMRRRPPVISEDRYTTKLVEWYGTEIPVGARVRVCMGSAHLDETVFSDPLTFDLQRPDLHMAIELRSGGSTDDARSGHLGFGLGKHFCIGYQLARTEAIIGSGQLLDRCRDIRIADGAEPHPTIQGNAFQAVETLPLTFRT